jgi:hypothetical protein
MTKLESYGVTELDAREYESVQGGDSYDFWYAVGYTTDLMVYHQEQAVANALDYYFR